MVFAVPFMFYWLGAMAWNLWFNIHMNHWWAGGNVYLIANSLFCIWQGVNASWLLFEIPIYLKETKLLRSMSLMLAILYNVIYLYFAQRFGMMLFKNNDGPMGAFEEMFFAYNLVLHLPILPINAVIILKEVQLERIQLLSNWADSDYADDNLSLGYGDFGRATEDFFWWMSPFAWLDFLW
jgi:hypothetical protein